MAALGRGAFVMGEAVLPYQYALLRAVPRVEREEFVNVGVVLYCQARDFLEADWHLDAGRLTALHPGLDLETLSGMLDTFGEVCAGSGAAGPARERLGTRFGWLTAPRSTVLQPGPVHGGLGADPAAELHRLRRALVGPI